MDMQIKTLPSVKRALLSIGSFLILFQMLLSPPVHAFGITLDGKTKFAGTPSGIIRDIEIVEESTFIASENGVFHLLGGRSEVIHYNCSNLRGTVADLSLGHKDILWIVEYGVGVFAYDLISGNATQPFKSEKWPKYAWRIEELNDYLVVSLIQGVVVVEKATGQIQNWASEIGVGYVSGVFSISTQNGSTAFLASSNYLLKVDAAAHTVKKIPVEMSFPKLGGIDSVSISKDEMFVGGREGLYKQNLKTEVKEFYPFENNTTSAYAMSDVFHSEGGRIYVAAGGLFEITNNTLKKPSFMSPLLGSEAIKSITRIKETSTGELLLASSQLGLISLSSTHEAINLVHRDDSVYRKNIHEFGYDDDTTFVVKTRKDVFELDIDTGELLSNSVNQNSNCIGARARQVRSIHIENNSGFDYCDLENTVQFNADSETFYSYRDNGENAVFELIRDHQIVDRFPAPKKMKDAFLSQSGEIVGFDTYNSIHIQMSKFNWKTISPNEGGWSSISCLIEIENEYLVCTSGQGVKSINKKTGEIDTYDRFADHDLRFIRAGMMSGKGNIWVSTNKGLYVLSKEDDVFSFKESHGIYDTDFEYGGLQQVGEKILLLGDRYSYVISEEALLKAIKLRNERKKEVVYSKFSWIDKSNVTHTVYPQYTRAQLPIVVDSDFTELSVDFVTSSHLDSDRETLEFRIIGIDDNWKPHPRSQAYLAISDIGHGVYEVQAKIAGSGNPIQSLRFIVDTPFYLTSGACLIYFGVFVLFLWAFRKQLIQEGWRWFKSTTLYTHLTRFEITDGQSKFEKMLRSKERQISDITHELRTPIQVIQGTLEQASGDTSITTKEFINIKENMRRVEQLIEQMRNDIPRASAAADYFKIYSLENIRFMVSSLEPLAKQKRQNLEIRIKGKRDISLVSDSLEKIITNLVQNAIKYTQEQGNIRVSVSIDSKILRITVTDDGEGIDDLIQDKVFDRFIRGETKEEGQGIGLSIVKSLVELNQGVVEVDSKRGVGTKFIVTLPVDDIEFVNSQAEELQLKGNASHQKSLLIVDDSREFRAHVFDLLSKNYRCLVAGNGEQALDVMQRFLVDLVITDQMMPKMDGLGLTREIRAHASHHSIPILMLSAKTAPELEKAALEEKVDYFLAKPVSNDEIVLRIEHFLSMREAQSLDEKGCNIPVFEYGCLEVAEFDNEKDTAFYLNFMAVLDKNFHREEFNRDQAAEQLLMSTRSLNRRMAELFKYNFSEFLSRYRIEKSIPILLEGNSVLDTCLDVGFGTAAYFSTSFKKVKNVPPKKYIEEYKRTVA